jgi:hypothetical protein
MSQLLHLAIDASSIAQPEIAEAEQQRFKPRGPFDGILPLL